jgi:hypothetical protein
MCALVMNHHITNSVNLDIELGELIVIGIF